MELAGCHDAMPLPRPTFCKACSTSVQRPVARACGDLAPRRLRHVPLDGARHVRPRGAAVGCGTAAGGPRGAGGGAEGPAVMPHVRREGGRREGVGQGDEALRGRGGGMAEAAVVVVVEGEPGGVRQGAGAGRDGIGRPRSRGAPFLHSSASWSVCSAGTGQSGTCAQRTLYDVMQERWVFLCAGYVLMHRTAGVYYLNATRSWSLWLAVQGAAALSWRLVPCRKAALAPCTSQLLHPRHGAVLRGSACRTAGPARPRARRATWRRRQLRAVHRLGHREVLRWVRLPHRTAGKRFATSRSC